MSNDEFNFDLGDSPGDQPSPSDLPAPNAGMDAPAADAPAATETDEEDKGKKGKKKKKKAKPKAKKKKKAKAPSNRPKVKQINVYSSMLFISLVCLTVATLLMYLELQRFGQFPWWKVNG